VNTPLWEIFQNGTNTPVAWTNATNYRFATYHPPGSPPDKTKDLVFDRETGLVWPRNGNLANKSMNWLDASTTSRELQLGGRMGWRLPTISELSSLLDYSVSSPALPAGHPFLLMQLGNASYWTSTVYENTAGVSWFVNFTAAGAGLLAQGQMAFVLPVRGRD
jgi:hypothetical protein